MEGKMIYKCGFCERFFTDKELEFKREFTDIAHSDHTEEVARCPYDNIIVDYVTDIVENPPTNMAMDKWH